jgi:TPP-dependent pyruvate/acetoin dehydrogenase alpha subunit
MAIPREQLLPLLESMVLMRRVEEAVCQIGNKEIFGNYHIYIGQEATGACVISLLQPEDAIFSTHRCHAHALARGIPLEQVMGELMLRDSGASRGKGGTQHIMSLEKRTVATSIVGSSTLLATGAALAARVKGDDWIAVAFLGERSLAEGVVPETFNLAGLWQLPVLYVCENNNANPYDPRRGNLSLNEFVDLPRAYGITAEAVDATDPEAVYPVAQELVQRVRKDRQPAFLEARTPAYPGRAQGGNPTLEGVGVTDLARAWDPRPDAPEAGWHEVDPLLRMAELALKEGVATQEQLLEIDRRVQADLEKATATARAASFPAPAGAFDHIYAGGDLWPR